MQSVQQQVSISITESSAYPPEKQPVHESPSHEILRLSERILNEIEIRAFQPSDIHQLKKLNLQFFPLRYPDSFYFKILNKEVFGYIAEVEVEINGQKLAQILEKQENIQKQQLQEIKEKRISERNLPSIKNQYFSLQKMPFFTHQYVKCKLIIGAVLFNIRDSDGYLSYPWWKTFMSDGLDSFYISTLGVISQFRNKKIAQKLLNNVMELAEGDQTIKLIYLHVIEYNMAARKLYEKIGFELMEEFKNYYKIDNNSFEGLALGKFINGGQKKQTWSEWISKFRI